MLEILENLAQFVQKYLAGYVTKNGVDVEQHLYQ